MKGLSRKLWLRPRSQHPHKIPRLPQVFSWRLNPAIQSQKRRVVISRNLVQHAQNSPEVGHPGPKGALSVFRSLRAAAPLGLLCFAPPPPCRSLRAPNSGYGFELGRSAPQVPALPGSTTLPTGTAQAQAAQSPVTVPEPKVAPVPSSPLPPRTMSPGPRLLLPAVLFLGLGALVSSSGSSGVRKRGPSVTDKVIQLLQQLFLRRTRHSGRLGDRTAVAGLERRSS